MDRRLLQFVRFLVVTQRPLPVPYNSGGIIQFTD